MNSAPVGIREIVAAEPALQARLAWQRRIVGAVVLVVAVLFTIGVDEARRWQHAIDVGLELTPEGDCIVDVTPGGFAERAGITRGMVEDIHDTRERWRRDTFFVELDGSLYAHDDVRQLTIHVRPFADGEEDCPMLRPWSSRPSNGRDVVVDIDGPTSLARDPGTWMSLLAVPFVVMLALFAGWIGSRRPWRHDDVESLRRRRQLSFVLPAIALTAVVPWWMHLAMLTLLDGFKDDHHYWWVLCSTVPAWTALVVIAARDAAHYAEGDFTTSSWRWMTVPILPAALLVVPGIVVLVTSVILLRLLRRRHRRAFEQEQALPR